MAKNIRKHWNTICARVNQKLVNLEAKDIRLHLKNGWNFNFSKKNKLISPCQGEFSDYLPQNVTPHSPCTCTIFAKLTAFLARIDESLVLKMEKFLNKHK